MPELHHVAALDADLSVTVSGDGPPLLLLHGWPHTHQVWSRVIPDLAGERTVIAPDMPGTGESSPAAAYDAGAVAEGIGELMTGLGHDRFSIMALDASVPGAFVVAMRHPQRLSALVLMESLLPPLPGAEPFMPAGPPWWFGFHSVPGLAETVLVGNEADYVGYFLDQGTVHGVSPEVREAFVAAYTGTERLSRGFEYYRAMKDNTGIISEATATARLTVPTLAIGGDSGSAVGEALAAQLEGITDDLSAHILTDVGHIVPLDAPSRLLDLVRPFLERAEGRDADAR